MARGTRPLVVGFAAACALAALVLWLLATRSAAPPPPTPAPSGARTSAPAAGPAPTPVSPLTPPEDAAGSGDARPRGAISGAPAEGPPPDEGPDAAAWRQAKVAFGLRELGAMAPYVKIGLDAARRDMESCFEGAGAAHARGAAPEGPRPEPAVLLLYLEAREGALDVVDTRIQHLGAAAPEVVACCREVLRGLEIPAFRAVPGRRYRLVYRLE